MSRGRKLNRHGVRDVVLTSLLVGPMGEMPFCAYTMATRAGRTATQHSTACTFKDDERRQNQNTWRVS